jgi:hypothetical protein
MTPAQSPALQAAKLVQGWLFVGRNTDASKVTLYEIATRIIQQQRRQINPERIRADKIYSINTDNPDYYNG